VNALGGLDAVVYATGVDPLVRIADVEADAWANLFATNVIGASLVVRAALPHLRAVNGRAVFISATSVGRPLPGMGAYATSKAALEELARAWRSEHPEVSFSTVAIGMTLGTGVTDTWDGDLLGELSTVWFARGHVFDNGPGYMQCPEVADTSWSRCWRHRRAFRSSRCSPTRRAALRPPDESTTAHHPCRTPPPMTAVTTLRRDRASCAAAGRTTGGLTISRCPRSSNT
jgi:NAD(P)-dependent dehydrogenase (short-subunit alcohol dehydrogenase family)